MGRFMAQKGLWNLAREKMLQDRGALPKEEGHVVREYKAMHEENFLGSWPPMACASLWFCNVFSIKILNHSCP